METLPCKHCLRKFTAIKKRKYCSKECYWASLVGRKLSEEHKRKIGRSGMEHPLFGKHQTEEARRKMSLAKKGRPTPWMKGRIVSEETKSKLRLVNLGKRYGESTRKLLSEMRKGARNVNWKGGVTPIHEAIRRSPEYKSWRFAVFSRDGFTCVICGKEGHGDIEADHIKPFSLYPDLRLVVSNGRTLCKACHLEHGWSLFKNANPRKRLFSSDNSSKVG